jgi:hypothetical protein
VDLCDHRRDVFVGRSAIVDPVELEGTLNEVSPLAHHSDRFLHRFDARRSELFVALTLLGIDTEPREVVPNYASSGHNVLRDLLDPWQSKGHRRAGAEEERRGHGVKRTHRDHPAARGFVALHPACRNLRGNLRGLPVALESADYQAEK